MWLDDFYLLIVNFLYIIALLLFAECESPRQFSKTLWFNNKDKDEDKDRRSEDEDLDKDLRFKDKCNDKNL